MSGTHSKILRAARFLFNQHGVANVSQRAIADHIAISPGNLTYHFKKRDDIIEALYHGLVDEMNEIFDRLEGENPTLETLLNTTKAMNKIFFENRFFMIDFIHILRSNKSIRKDYAELSKKRQGQTIAMMEQLISNGLVRKEELPREYELFYRRLQLFGDFWIASIGTTEEEVMLKHTRVYTEMFMQSLYPYLTATGKKEFKSVMGY